LPVDPLGLGSLADQGGRARVPVRHGVSRYLARRVLQAVLVLLLVVTIVFGLSHLAANPVDILLPPGFTEHQRAVETRLLGLNKPLVEQYGIFLRNVATGNFGTSTLFHVPILPLVLTRSVATLRLAAAALITAALIGVPVGVVLAVRAGTWLDRITGLVVGVAQGVASFWLAVVLVFVFAVYLKVLPVLGDHGFSSIILPATALAVAPLVSFIRLTRSAVIDALATDYVKIARSRGIRPSEVVIRHALRNSLVPVLTYGGVLAGQLLSGAVITETIFAWPGIGQLSILAIQNGDYGVVEVVTMFAATAVIVLNILVDIAYLILDPRVRDTVAVGGRR
jgi:peptide/nickel transport system permease protein